MLSKEKIKQAAEELNCSPAVIVAVDKVESGGKGFLSDGQPKILFEPHIFWKELRKVGIRPEGVLKQFPEMSDILYPIWGGKPYGKQSEQHARLQRAATIHREAALSSASWGRYQIMGFNYKLCKCNNLQGFINKMYKSEDDHLDLFVAYIQSRFLDDELRNLDWSGFARQYNGSQYVKNRYHIKLAQAYKEAKLAGW